MLAFSALLFQSTPLRPVAGVLFHPSVLPNIWPELGFLKSEDVACFVSDATYLTCFFGSAGGAPPTDAAQHGPWCESRVRVFCFHTGDFMLQIF